MSEISSDYYERLGLDPNRKSEYTDADIRQARREMSTKHHPDRGGSADTMAAINEAFNCLIDPEKKAYYDRMGVEPGQEPKPTPTGLFSEIVMTVLTQIMSHPVEIVDSIDFDKLLKHAIQDAENHTQQEVKQLERAIKRYDKIHARVLKVGNAPDIIRRTMEENKAQAEKALKAKKTLLKCFEQVYLMAKEYNFAAPTSLDASSWRPPKDPFRSSFGR